MKITDQKSLLTVCCVAYNQETYIRDALESFVMQKTDFPFYVLIGDDASCDSTPNIICEYAEKYPAIVKPILRDENIGATRNSLDLYSRVDTKYVALCDGDDYWTDPNKLQIQVDFLEKHKNFTICFHPVLAKWQDRTHEDEILPPLKRIKNRNVFGFRDLLKGNVIYSSSVVFRWQLAGRSEIFPEDIVPGDWFLQLLHAWRGKVGFINKLMSVYRINHTSWETNTEDEIYRKYGYGILCFYDAVEKEFGISQTKAKRRSVVKMFYPLPAMDIVKVLTKYPVLVPKVKRHYCINAVFYKMCSLLSFGASKKKFKGRFEESSSIVKLLDDTIKSF
ncbi:MAG: glycosyltransferase [Prevotella sp.]|jgi:glycosyltransferase involved in cell wall biosynthesis|nr:glycosyltransferase [Prevotella sp.]